MKSILSILVICLLTFYISSSFGEISSVFAHDEHEEHHDQCQENTFTYEKSSDFSDSKIEIDFKDSNKKVEVSAKSGYQITEVWLEIKDKEHDYFHKYGTSAGTYSSEHKDKIAKVKVVVKKVCPAPTASPTPTPKPTIIPEPTATPSATPTPGNQSGTSDSGTSTPSAPTCNSSDPGPVTLLSVIRKGSSSVELKWTKSVSATHYTITYGPSSGNYMYGVTNTGNTDTIIISGLIPNQKYFFAVIPVNDCMPGKISNEVSSGSVQGSVLGAGIGGGEVLGISTDGTNVLGLSNTATGGSEVSQQIDPFILKILNPINFNNSPKRIVISKLGIDLTVKESKIANGYWTVSGDSATHGLGTAGPGEQGKNVIFAHNVKGLFVNLTEAKISDIVSVEANGSWYNYQVAEIKKVNPDDLSVIASDSSEELVLYTCTGQYDNQRLVVTAKRFQI
jgi:LPXTG-site transpeptidase (sortase) family protein